VTEGFSKLQALSAVRDDRTLTKAEKLVLVMLISHASKSGECFPSFDLLAKECDMARSVVAQALADLRARGVASPVRVHVTRRYRAAGRGRDPNVYRLELSPAGGLKSRPSKSGGRTQVGDVLSPEIDRSKSEKGPVLSPAGGLEAVHEAVHEAGKGSAATSAAGSFALEAPQGKAPKKRSSRSKPRSPQGPAHQQVTKAYFEAFRAQHGRDPIFAGAEGSAVSRLLKKLEGKGDAPEACRRIGVAFRNYRKATVTILDIARAPDSFASDDAPRRNAVAVQRGGLNPDLLEAARARGEALAAGE
jgi:hypothetical protein